MIKLYRISAVENEGVVKILSKLFSENYGVYDTSEEPVMFSPRMWEQRFSLDDAIIAVGTENPKWEYNDVLGYCTFRPKNYADLQHLTAITSLCVKRQYRRNRIATYIIDDIVNFISPGGLLSVATRNPVVLDLIALRPDMELIQLPPEDGSGIIDANFSYIYSCYFNETFTQITADFPVRQEIDSPMMKEKLDFWKNTLGELEYPGNEWIIICKKGN